MNNNFMKYFIIVFATGISLGLTSVWASESDKDAIIEAVEHYRLGLSYSEKYQYDLAILEFNKAIGMKPDYAEAYYALGQALAKLNKIDAAIASYEKAITYKPDYQPEVLNLVGGVYLEAALAGKSSLNLALSKFLKALESCKDNKDSLYISIIQNIVTTYLYLYSESQSISEQKKEYLENALYYGKKATNEYSKSKFPHTYAMLQMSLGDTYVQLGGRDNILKSERAYNEALNILTASQFPVEHNTALTSLKALKENPANEDIFFAKTSPRAETHGKSIAIQLVDEAGKPLRGAKASLIEQNGEEFIKAHFRDRPVGENGKLTLPSSVLNLPKGSELFIRTQDGFYWHEIKIDDFSVSGSNVKLVIPKTGTITATISNYTKGIEQPLVVPLLKLNEHGSYEEFTGIGIGLSFSYPFSINGLPTGIYKLQVKKNYKDLNVYFEKAGIKVVAGEITDIGKIELKALR